MKADHVVHSRIWVVFHYQNQDLQFNAHRKAGCEKICHEKISGVSLQRLEYIRVISELRCGDVIVVLRIDYESGDVPVDNALNLATPLTAH